MLSAKMPLNERSLTRVPPSECSDEVHLIPHTFHPPSFSFTAGTVARTPRAWEVGPDDARVLLGFFTEQNPGHSQHHLPLSDLST